MLQLLLDSAEVESILPRESATWEDLSSHLTKATGPDYHKKVPGIIALPIPKKLKIDGYEFVENDGHHRRKVAITHDCKINTLVSENQKDWEDILNASSSSEGATFKINGQTYGRLLNGFEDPFENIQIRNVRAALRRFPILHLENHFFKRLLKYQKNHPGEIAVIYGLNPRETFLPDNDSLITIHEGLKRYTISPEITVFETKNEGYIYCRQIPKFQFN